MKNKDTWQFAHRYCGKIWKIGGWILLPVSALAMIGTVGKSEDCIGTVGLLICAVQIAAIDRIHHFDRKGIAQHV